MKKLFVFMIALLISGLSFGQLTGPKSIPGDYATIALAITDLNTVGVGAGGVTFNIAAGYTETAPLNGFVVLRTGTLSDQIIFQKSGAGANPLITAYAGGVGTPGTPIQDGIWSFVGSDYVTIDGIDLIDLNAANPATMEFGYGFFKASITDGCQYNTIKNCVVTLNRINNATGTSPTVEGSKAITFMNCLPNTQTTILVPTTAAGTNSYNKFYTNTLQNCNYGISIIGYAGATPFTLCDFGNDIGGNSVATGNIIRNFGGGAAATNPAAAVRTLAQYDINVSYNTINNNDGGGVNHLVTLRGIYLNTAVNANATISRNTMTIQSGTIGANQVSVIENVSGGTGAGNTININYNTITGGSNSTSTSGIYYCIYNSATPSTLNILNNLITNNTITGTSTTPFIETGSPVSANVNNNQIINNTRTGISGTWYLLKTTSPTNLVANGNTINNNNWTNVLSTGTIAGIYGFSSSVNVTLNNNIISNLSTPTTGLIYGIREFGSAGTKIVQGNQIFNLGTGGAGTIYGIYLSAGTSIDVSKNKIYNLASLTGAGALVYGINVATGAPANIYNNYISDLRALAATGANAINGINISGGTNVNAYYNTVYLNAVSSGAGFGTSGIYASSTPNVDLKNNIIVNTSTPMGAGITAAYRRSSATLTTYSTTANNNDFYAGVPSATNLIFYDGTNSMQTIGAYQTFVAPREAASFSNVPPFVNIATTPYDLHLQTTIATMCESGGFRITTPVITNDYDSDIRWGEIGYTGSGINTDIGADEFNGIPSFTCAAPTPGNTLATSTTLCLGQSITLSLQNATAGTGVSYQWQSSPTGVVYSNIVGATSSTYVTSPSSSTYYHCIVTCINGPVSATSAPVQIVFGNNITGTTPGSRCGAGTVNLSATGSAGTTLNWYNAATGGSILGTGSPFATPVIPSTTTFYVGAEISAPTTSVLGIGAGTNTTSSYPAAYGSYWGNVRAQYLVLASELSAIGLGAGNITSLAFDVTALGSPVALTGYTISMGATAATTLAAYQPTSTIVYGPSNYTPVIGSFASNTHVFATPFLWDGASNVVIEVCFNNGVTGSTNALTKLSTTTFTSSIYYGVDGAIAGGVCANTTISGSSLSRPNMQIAGTGTCSSPRAAVIATIGASPVLTITGNQTLCNNVSGTLSVTSTLADYNSYTWSPVTDLFTDAACTIPYIALGNSSTVYVKSTTGATVTYTCTANNTTTFCSNIATSAVTVLPSLNISASASANPICEGSPVTLTGVISSSSPQATYTTPPAVSNPTSDEDLGNITFGTLNNTTVINSLVGTIGTATGTAGSYSDFTSFGPYSLIAGTTYPLSVSSITSASPYGNAIGVYIDYNRNGVFTDPGEAIYVSAATTSGAHTETANITIPLTAQLGLTRMRVLVNEGLITGSAMSVSWGEYEEYSLNITSQGLVGMTFAWSDGTATVGTSNPLTINPTVSHNYTLTATDLNSCNYTTSPVAVNVTPLPATPTAINSTQCGAAIPACSVTSNSGATSPIFNWYTTTTGGTPIAGNNGNTYTLPVSVPTHFYVSEINGTCESPRVDVFANVGAAPILTISADQTVCNNSTAMMTVTSTLSDFNLYQWSPVTDLYTDAACSVPYVALANATTVYSKSIAGGTQTYTCNSTNTTTLCTNIATSTVTTIPASQTVTHSGSNFCLSGSSTLTATPNTGYGSATFQWQESSDNVSFTNIVGATSPTFTTPVLTSTTYYRILAKIGGLTCSTSLADSLVINDPQILFTGAGSRCGTGTVNLSAIVYPTTTVNWYANATGGASLGTGVNFTTPIISATTNFYAEGSIGGSSYTIGAPNTSISALLAGQTTTTSGINFDVLSPSVKINSIDVYPTAALGSTFTITVKQGASIVATYTGTTTVSGTISAPVVQTVPVNFTIPAGTGYQITLPTNPGIIRNSGGAAFPYTAPGVISLTSSTLSGYYYNFYNWQVSTGCISSRVLVTATVTSAPAITVTATPAVLCEGQTTSLTATSTNASYTYTWTPATSPATGSTVNGTPLSTTVFTVTATDVSGGTYDGCATIGTAAVTVNPVPVVTANSNFSSIYCGDSINLSSTPNSGITNVLVENFNGATNSWTTTNTSNGTTPALADWTLEPDGYIYGGTTFHSNDSTQFYMSNSDVLGSGVNTITTLESPSFSTVGIATCNLSFYHYYNYYNTADTTIVEIFDGTTWNTVAHYITDQGTAAGFTPVTIPMNSYVGLSNVKIRFSYKATYGFYWAIDNVKVFENNDTYTYAWTSTPAGFTSTLQNPTGIIPVVTTTYHATVLTSAGCSASADTTVIVNAGPAISLGNDTTICTNTTYTITATSTATSYLWSNGGTTSSIVVGPFATAGTQTFTVTATSGLCSNTATINILVDPCTGISSSPEISVNVQPNPTNGLTSIIVTGLNGNALMSIYNLAGQLISEENIQRIDSRFSKQIDMSTYPKGIYYLKLNNNEKVVIKKIVVN